MIIYDEPLDAEPDEPEEELPSSPDAPFIAAVDTPADDPPAAFIIKLVIMFVMPLMIPVKNPATSAK